MVAVEASPLPRWLDTSVAGWVALALALLAVALTGGFLLHEKHRLEAAEIEGATLYARVLQNQAERTFDTIDIALHSLADGVRQQQPGAESDGFSQEMRHMQLGLPFLRSVSLMRGDGRIVASTSPVNVDISVDVKKMQLPGPGAADALGSSINGRDLIDLQVGRTPSAGALHTFVPMVRAVDTALGARLYLVAAINPDFFGNAYELALADASRSAGMFSIQAMLMAGTGNLRMAPGQAIERHRFFTDFLPARESGSFIGAGIDGVQVVTAFRTLRTLPIVIVVERNYAHLQADLHRTAAAALSLCGAALLVIGGAAWLARRSLRAQRAVQRALDATRQDVASSERDLRLLVEGVHELVFRADRDGRIAFVNARWHELTGRPAAHILGRRLADVCQADESQACDRLFDPRGSRALPTRVHIDNALGHALALDLSVSCVVDADGNTLAFAGFAVDVSQREAAQQALQSQLNFTAQLLDVNPTPIFVKDTHGRFVMVNRAWLELMGLTLPDVLGRNSHDLFGGDAARHHAHDMRLLESEERVRYENRLVVAGRSARDTIVTKVRFTRADGSPAGIVGSIVDVTEFREAERHILKSRDAAEVASRAKSEFIANISHELRTPLQGILGFSEMGRELSGDVLDLQDMFKDIHAGGQRMLTLVNGLLDVSLMDSAVGSLPLQRSDLTPIVRAAVDHLRPQADQRSQTFTLHGLDRAHVANVEPARWREAVQHLLSNALRYSPVGGAIDVRLTDLDPQGFELTVRDRGPGIPADELELVFDAFVQSSRTRDGSGGTGLGLTIARKIMNAHGGSIRAAPADDGVGTLVSLRLPAADARADAPSQVAPTGADDHALSAVQEA